MAVKRFGKFYVSREILEGEDFSEVLAKMKFVPYHVNCVHMGDTFVFTGVSPLFDEVLEGRAIMVYGINVTRTKANHLYVSVISENCS